MGQSHQSGTFFHDVAIKEHFSSVPGLWTEQELATLIDRLKDMTLNFSLDKVKFTKLLQLPVSYEEAVGKWFVEFSHDRASQVVDGLEFLSAMIMVSWQVPLFKKICLLFILFDLDKTGCVRKDEFTIMLKAVTTGLHRVLTGLPPPATVIELGGLSAEFFHTLSNEVLSQRELLMWMTEAHYSLHYLSVLSKLGSALFAWGANRRHQLGLNLEPEQQRVPAPLLPLEGVRIAKVATHESHSLFLTEEGAVWSCGMGFCGILGHGDVEERHQPHVIEALSHSRVIDVAVGVRHSVAVSDKGQVFTWGAADMAQLGHGGTDDTEIYTWATDPTSGRKFAYVVKPTVVMDLHGKRVVAKSAACCNFSTAVVTEDGALYTWGNNTDGQCGHGQQCEDHRLIFVDPHMHRTAMQVLLVPRLVEKVPAFKKVACGGYHMLAIDQQDRLWTWGRGHWGVLGHGDIRSSFVPKLVNTLKYHICNDVVAGELHSMCSLSLYRLTITGSNPGVELSAFSLLGLPAGRVDRQSAARKVVNPPNTLLSFNAFVSAPLLQLDLGLAHNEGSPVVDHNKYPHEEIQKSVVLIERSLWEGEWLKLDDTDFDFKVVMSSAGARIPPKVGVSAQLMYGEQDKYEASDDCNDKVCIFECPASDSLEASILELVTECEQGRGLACIVVLPQGIEPFDLKAEMLAAQQTNAPQIPFGVMSHDHGAGLKKYVLRRRHTRTSQAADGILTELSNWQEDIEDFTGRPFYENIETGAKRYAPPQIELHTQATLLSISTDTFLPRLKAIIELQPKGVIVCQQSWRPDVEMTHLPEELLEELQVPIVTVTFEAGEELRSVAGNGCAPYVTMEFQPFGGLCGWGNGTHGQLGLAKIENRVFLKQAIDPMSGRAHLHTTTPCYVAHLHEHQVTGIAAGANHTLAVTHNGEVFSWGIADGLGVPLDTEKDPTSEYPMFVEQFEGLVKATKVFAGHYHSFAVGDMPYKSVM
mmetsp:Transcript_67928/g.196699  ORF Transcript_67928/g.196699 Transcript_67928/m.196699 type:complete len:982 (+) Transcript_67928:42-2987(+)